MAVKLKKNGKVVEAIYERGVLRPVKELLDAFEGVEAREDVDEVFSELRRRDRP